MKNTWISIAIGVTMFLVNGIMMMISLNRIDGLMGVLYITMVSIMMIILTTLYWIRIKTPWYKIVPLFLFGALFATFLIGWIFFSKSLFGN